MKLLPNILIVDDSFENLTFLKAVLGKTNFNLIQADSGAEALEKARGTELALAILDVRMPKMGGLELAVRLNEGRTDEIVPVIFLTASDANVSEIFDGYNSGAVDYLIKPVDARILLYKVNVFISLFNQRQIIKEEKKLLEESNDELLRVNSALKLSEEKYRSYVVNALDGILISDRKGMIVEVNNALCHITGFSKDELLDMAITDILAEESIEAGKDFLNSKYTDDYTDVEVLIRTKTGIKRWRSLIFSQNAHNLFFRFTLDITNQKLESAYLEFDREVLQILNEPIDLKDSLRRIATAFKIMSGYQDIAIRLRRGESSPYFDQVGFSLGFDREANIQNRDDFGVFCRDKDGNLIEGCFCENLLSASISMDSPLLTTEGSFWTNDASLLSQNEDLLTRKFFLENSCIKKGYQSIAIIPIRDKENIIGMIQISDERKGCFDLLQIGRIEGIASHIGAALARKQFEDDLRKSEFILKQAQTVSHMGYYVTDLKTGIWESSSALDEIFGIDSSFVRNIENWSSLIEPVFRQDLLDYYNKVTKEKSRFDREYKIKRPVDGQIRWVSALGEFDYDESGNALRLIGTIQDITDRKVSENELRKLVYDLNLSQKIGKLGSWKRECSLNCVSVFNSFIKVNK